MSLGRIWVLSRSLLGALILAPSLQAQPVSSPQDPLFADDSPLEITLRGPFEELDQKRDKTATYPKGALSYLDGDEIVNIGTSFLPRGNFRLKKENCQHAQLWLELKKKHVRRTLFAKQKKLKLVVQCRDSKRYQSYLRKEFQAYRMLNQLTNLSYRVRWVEVTFKNLEGETLRRQPAFFIEHKDRLAKRLGAEIVNKPHIAKTELDPEQATMMSLFNYFIGNADYSLISSKEGSCCHNAKLFLRSPGTSYLPVIYDFDSSGYVSAPYAITPAQLNLRSVRQRLYRGFCVEDDVFERALEQFQMQRESLLAIGTETDFVGRRAAKKGVSYLEGFYDVVDNPKQLNRKVRDVCR